MRFKCIAQMSRFQSTLPVWGATAYKTANFDAIMQFQSTLPVWGATASTARRGRNTANFNPRSPCGARRQRRITVLRASLFQSTLPVWGATVIPPSSITGLRFQSTLPMWGAT